MILNGTLGHLGRQSGAWEGSGHMSPKPLDPRYFTMLPSLPKERFGFQVDDLRGLSGRVEPSLNRWACEWLSDFPLISVTEVCIIFRTDVLDSGVANLNIMVDYKYIIRAFPRLALSLSG